MAYFVGDPVELTTTYTDPDTGDAVDPSSVELTVTDPSGNETTPTVSNPDPGKYTAVFTVSSAGRWSYVWASTNPDDVEVGTLTVSPVTTTSQALITLGDFTARYEDTLTSNEEARVKALIHDASAIVRNVAGSDFIDDDGNLVVPGEVTPVVCNMVRRALVNPDEFESETIGPFSGRGRPTSIFLTSTERRIVRAAAGISSANSIDLSNPFPSVSGSWLDGAL